MSSPKIPFYKNKPRQLAENIIEKVRQGIEPNVYQEAIRVGYSVNSAKTYRFKSALEFQEVMQQNKDITAKKLEQEKQAILKDMKKKRPAAKYRDLSYAFDIANKNQRLISGESTENVSNKGSIVMLPAAEDKPLDDTQKE